MIVNARQQWSNIRSCLLGLRVNRKSVNITPGTAAKILDENATRVGFMIGAGAQTIVIDTIAAMVSTSGMSIAPTSTHGIFDADRIGPLVTADWWGMTSGGGGVIIWEFFADR